LVDEPRQITRNGLVQAPHPGGADGPNEVLELDRHTPLEASEESIPCVNQRSHPRRGPHGPIMVRVGEERQSPEGVTNLFVISATFEP
jgi:hypothetical protein